MKKISVNKSDDAAIIVEKIIDADVDEIVLIIPRFSHLAESLENFHLLKREADAINKKILIESVDTRVIELAELAKIEAINPFFVKNKKQFSDIVPKKNVRSAPAVKKHSNADNDLENEEEFLKQLSSESFESGENGIRHNMMRNEIFKKENASEISDADKEGEKWSFFKKIPIKTLGALIILGVIAYGAATILPRADIKIVTKKLNWSYNDSVITQLSAKPDYTTVTIPNQKFTATKNTTMSFPATGKKQVSNVATGTITIYNSYSSSPQPLVKNTRFMSPDGKIFLLTKAITVPGAKVSEGKIIPSSIDAAVVAEKAGAEYNIDPVKLFTIPGFQGGPKYNAFYGQSKSAMSGGFVGELAYPTTADISAATKKISDSLQSDLKTSLYAQISGDFKIIDGATSFSILNQTNDTNVDKDGNFSVFANGQMSIIAFKESDLIDILKQKAEAENSDYQVKSYDIQYGVARTDASGRMSFPVTFNAILSYKIDADQLKRAVAGNSDIDLRKAIFSLPGLDTANVSLWPFWVKTVPKNINKINVVID
ncbi:MAG: hypothetical protein M1155_02725 [Patescibacteria group bacterium]|nr:hypothetical protein [Patescibacteria group bacterium]